MKKYIHYGGSRFEPSKFDVIRNGAGIAHNKPWGGLWGSPVDSACGWKWFASSEGIVPLSELTEENSFIFTLREDARILTIKNREDSVLPMVEMIRLDGSRLIAVDYVGLSAHYDAVEVEIQHTYFCMSGWDCDSIVVLNPDVIVEVKERRKEGA